MIKAGTDLVYLPKFKKALEKGGENFLRRVFLAAELENKNIQHLAGIFAAKEAVMKALALPPDAWQDIHIKNRPNGAPEVEIPHSKLENYSLSISHDGGYVVAQFVVVLESDDAPS